jgi:hypothetical protein
MPTYFLSGHFSGNLISPAAADFLPQSGESLIALLSLQCYREMKFSLHP